MTNTLQLQLPLATSAAWANRQQAGVIAHLVDENRILKDNSGRVGYAFASRMTSAVG